MRLLRQRMPRDDFSDSPIFRVVCPFNAHKGLNYYRGLVAPSSGLSW